MTKLSNAEFERKYPRRACRDSLTGPEGSRLVVERDSLVDGLAAHVIVRSGVHAEVAGIFGSLTVEPEAVVYVSGLVDGDVDLAGALCVSDGHVSGKIRASSDAVLADLERNSDG